MLLIVEEDYIEKEKKGVRDYNASGGENKKFSQKKWNKTSKL